MENKKIKILAIDDNRDNLITLKAIIYEVLPQSVVYVELSGQGGIESARKNEPDVILLDILMPGMDGYEVCKILKADEQLSETPIIFLTALKGDKQIRILALEAGGEAFLAKPVDSTELKAQIHAMLKIKEAATYKKDKRQQLEEQVQKRTEELKNANIAALNLLEDLNNEIEIRKQREEALKESEVKYRYMFENNPQPMWIYDLETLSFLEVNGAAINHYGYSREEFLSMTLKDIRQKEDIELLLQDVEKTRMSYNIAGQWQHLKKNGELIFVEITSHSITFNNRNARHVIVNDITEQKQAEEKLKLLNRAVEASSVAVEITDAKGNINYINPFFTENTGYSYEEVMGKNPRFLKSGQHPKTFYEELWNTILSGREWTGEFQNKKKNGELYWEKAVISPILNSKGRVANFVAIKDDITEKKKMIQELIESKEKAEAANRLKTAFLNNISHEVRTPLNGILGFGELMARKDLKAEDKQLYLSILRKSSDRLMNTITDYMDISLITSGNMTVTKKQIYLSQIFDSVFVDFEKKCTEKNLKFNLLTEGCDGQIIETDVDLLLKVITHIMDNAVKFTASGHITFECRFADYTVEFIIDDSGCGIDKEMQQMVFETFTQENFQTTRSHEGSGLGLSISKGIVELLGGKIELESEKGTGTKVQIALPLNKQLIETEQSSDIKIKAEGLPTILVVEDDEDNRFLLEIMLEGAGLNLIMAEDGGVAIKKFNSHPEIDLVLMDLRLPVMDGFEVTRKIKKIKPSLPVIAVTAFALHGDENEAMKAGCDDYFSKPYNKKTLFEKIGKFINLNPDVK